MLTIVQTILQQGQIYLAIYACLGVAMIVELIYENQVLSRWIARAGIVVVILFIGLRWDTGTDWQAYLRVFYVSDSEAEYDAAIFGIDQGYILLNRLVYYFSTDYSVFLLIDAAIAIGCVYIFIERSTKYPVMGVYLFYTSYALTHFMGSNRRMLAIGFVCLGFLVLKERRLLRDWIRWSVPFGLAAAVHRTSLLALPGLIVGKRAWSTALVILGLLICLALGLSGAPFSGLETLGNFLSEYTGITVVEKLIFYTSGEVELPADFDIVRQATLGVAKRSTTLVILIAYMRYGDPSTYAQRLYNIYIVGCGMYFIMLGSPIFQIISTYYSIVEIALLPIMFSGLPRLKVPYTLYLLVIPLFLLLSALSPYLDLYVPYTSVLTTY